MVESANATMRAARFYAWGEPLRVETVPRPRLWHDDDVLVRVAAVGLCGSDIHIAIEGITPTGFQPIALGHEIAGTVEQVGAEVRDWAPGDRVAVAPLVFDGTCVNCLAGHAEVCLHRRGIGIHVDGGLGEYVVVPARNLCRLPGSVPFEVGAVVTDAVATPFHALVDVGRVRAGESVAVIGVGGLGLHAVQIARLLGAFPVIAVDPRPTQRDRALEQGADVALDPGSGTVLDDVHAATGGRGVDVAAEFVGRRESIAQAVDVLRIGGRTVVAGLGADPITVVPPTTFVRKQLALLGSYGFTVSTIRQVLGLVESGRLDLSRSITHTFALDDVNTALRVLHEKTEEPHRVVVTHALRARE
ncbi:2-desacetyl-2-hydroxyethyl bacteriochlorophyllide A dehydrogenase [Actinomycetospora succinea]|uniref:2-desacetyl-2-hydroxyethyl bacteriochlorophyllide A dehydrogenase n=1 Tax=Actinomycetospora succinea TaxID=663603 RepID=A0A4R6VGW1_9PSEU|nr:zinc-binding dehydrogenase [Actinomycetospora succinea]TDQ60524.1 2-desacetyl-2-hydroxyethyl bacteriochlorophyllide A dehydrogenase [Actinomycetospora succinea]